MALEDRLFGGNALYVDLTPDALWGVFKKHASEEEMDAIFKHVSSRAGGCCEICGAGPSVQGLMGKKAHKFGVEWRFVHHDERGISELKRVLHVCTGCKQAIHLRQTQLVSANMPADRSPLVAAMARLSQINGMNADQISEILRAELQIWGIRSERGFPKNLDAGVFFEIKEIALK